MELQKKLQELRRERLKLIKERHREIILKPREEKEREIQMLYEWDEEPDVLNDAMLARELRRQMDEDED